MSGRSHAPRITRRRVIVATGAAVGAPLALAACGTPDELEERSEANDPDLLNSVLAEQLAVQEAASQIEPAPKLSRAASKSLLAAREKSISQLESYITERDGEPTDEPAESVQAESPTEALARQLEASIEASLAAIGDLSSPAYRQAIHRYITEDAAALAAMRSVLGEEIVPDAFVMGPAGTQEDDG